MTTAEAFAAQDGIDYSKWQAYLLWEVRNVSNQVLEQMLKDLNQERDRRVDELIGDCNEQ
jgi:hypothetical protein